MKRIPKHLVEMRSRWWPKLLAVDQAIRKRFPSKTSPGLDAIGLRMHSVPHVESYFCSPVNALSFAGNGAEAIFSFLILSDQVFDESPIVLTCVGSGVQSNFIVGKSLHDFLCLGYHRGFFALEQMGYDSERTLTRLTSGRWKPESDADWWNGFGVNDEQRPVLDYFRRAMKLRPWKNAAQKFAKLQQHLPLLELRTSMFVNDWEKDEFRAWEKWLKKGR